MISLMSCQSVASIDRWVWPAMNERNIAARWFVPFNVCYVLLVIRSTSRHCHSYYLAHINVERATALLTVICRSSWRTCVPETIPEFTITIFILFYHTILSQRFYLLYFVYNKTLIVERNHAVDNNYVLATLI